MNKKVLYIGGFELPDCNAAAQRVIGIGKAIRKLGYEVIFLNARKQYEAGDAQWKEYFSFRCWEYRRENDFDYLFCGNTVLGIIKQIKPAVVIAYNYPAVALSRICCYCKKNSIRCISDVTEWYEAKGNLFHKAVKQFDVNLRMYCVLLQMDGIIAISRYLDNYYRKLVPTVMIPPTVDCTDEKWNTEQKENRTDVTHFVYAGSPSASKERLDLTVDAICACAQTHKVRLDVIGITAQQFSELYGRCEREYRGVYFCGRIDHKGVVKLVTKADWAIIIRESSRMVQAGFPTKLVESISCGTPVIVNPFSNICDYLDETNSLITDIGNLHQTIEKACTLRCTPDKNQFDYSKFILELEKLFPRIED